MSRNSERRATKRSRTEAALSALDETMDPESNAVIGVVPERAAPQPPTPVSPLSKQLDELMRQMNSMRGDLQRERTARIEAEQRLRDHIHAAGSSTSNSTAPSQPNTAHPNNQQVAQLPLPPLRCSTEHLTVDQPQSIASSMQSYAAPQPYQMPGVPLPQPQTCELPASAAIASTISASVSTCSGETPWNGPSATNNPVPATLTHKPFELPQFDGKPEQWPLFISAYRQSTQAFGYGALQNIFRLQKCLHGDAMDAVRCLLMNPANLETLLSTLEFRFGRPELLVQDQIARIREIEPIDEQHYDKLIPFASRVQNLVAFLNTEASRHVLTETSLLAELVSKLPLSRKIEWAQHSAPILPRPSALDFSTWLQRLAHCVSAISIQSNSIQQPATRPTGRTPRAEKRVLLSVAENQHRPVCVLCNNPHKISDCSRFRRLSVSERWTAARRNQLCFGCLRVGHTFDECRSKRVCEVNGCERAHHQALHNNAEQQQPLAEMPQRMPSNYAAPPQQAAPEPAPRTRQSATTESSRSESTEGTRQNPFAVPSRTVLTCREEPEDFPILFRILPVELYGPSTRISTHALLDEGSSLTLLDADISDELQLAGPMSSLRVQGIGQNTSTEPSQSVSVDISGAGQPQRRFHVSGVRTVRNLNLPMQSVVLSQVDRRHHHLCGLPIAEYRNVTPKMLIGLDNSHLGVPETVRTSTHGGPIAAKTRLGWVIYGKQSPPIRANVLHCCEPQDEFARLEKLVQHFYTTESFGVMAPERMLESDEDMRARVLLRNTTVRLDNRFQTGLLWRNDITRLPDSYNMALQRLVSVERKLRREPENAALYAQQIESYIAKGYARQLTSEEASITDCRTWYLPHFGVTSIHKPGRIRIVFDAAAMVQGISLNSVLIKGPDLNKPLGAILFQFRVGAVGVCGDIAEMFHQVVIQPSDRRAQRFLWRKNASQQPDVFEMNVMTFGATCSPTSAQYIKNLNATIFENDYPEAAAAIKNSHYVDDYVASFATEEEAATVTRDVVAIHRSGGFVLRRFISNSENVLQILGEERERGRELDLQLDSKGADKILGMRWDTESDSFTFAMSFDRVNADVVAGTRQPTKRELLSITMSVFDPFGFLADFMLNMKLLLQDLWRTKTKWDETVPEPICRRWLTWRNELENIRRLQIPRCYSPLLHAATDIQLHIFADASEEAFAAVAYWRIAHEGHVHISFVTGKTKCAPVKMLTVPRLELQAAVLAVRLYKTIVECHNVRLTKTTMWTDSRTVLAWIQSVDRRFKPFVAHRVGEILDGSTSSWWRWIPTLLNVADDATRRLERPVYDVNSRWIRGPDFLALEETSWPTLPTAEAGRTDDELPEELRLRFVGVLTREPVVDFNRFSNLNTLRRVTGWMLRFAFNARAHRRGDRSKVGELEVNEIENATNMLCRLAQMEGFPAEYAALSAGQNIEKSSSIRTLLPYLDADRVMRIFGRTDAADGQFLPTAAQRPILLPTRHPFTERIVMQHHAGMGHQFENGIICAVRQRYWVPNLRRLVRGVKSRCMVCRINSAQPQPPVAGQLPEDRLTPHVFAFTFTGLDYFGPVVVTVGRRQEKRWIALFTCLTIRAVHMEVAEDLSTDACLVCIRNFINTRGVPRRIRSDCGTNFVGADNEIRRASDFFDMAAIQRELSIKGVEWRFNCPANPEAGGAWERLVQSAKRVLAVTLKTANPRVETLRSFVIEASNILNSRPLTHLPVTPFDLEPLTPNHFLLGRANSSGTPGTFDPRQLCQRKQWRVCQQLRNRFWNRWIQDYLPELTRRTKFYKDVGPLKVDDLVLICDANQARGDWKRGRIEKVIVGTDGRVRTADVRTSGGIMRRPISKLAMLDVEDVASSPSVEAD